MTIIKDPIKSIVDSTFKHFQLHYIFKLFFSDSSEVQINILKKVDTIQLIMPHILLAMQQFKMRMDKIKKNGWTNKHEDIKRVSDHLNKVPHVGIE